MKSCLFWLLVLYLCVPHHLLQQFGMGAELKLFDVFAAGIFLLLLLTRVRLDLVYRAFGAFAGWYLVRSAFAIQQIGIESVLFGVKFVEYFVVCLAVQKMDGKALQRLLLWLSMAMTACMAAELLGVNLTPTFWRGRLSAQFGGPYELGAVSLLLAIAATNARSRVVGAVGVVFSGAKASIIGFAAFLTVRLRDARWAFALIFLGVILAVFAGDRLSGFFGNTDFFLNTAALQEVYESIPAARTFEEYQSSWFDRSAVAADLPVDVSTGLRVYSYILAVKSLSPLDFLWGKGPGFFSAALDSSVLRVFVETGLLGIILLLRFLSRVFSEFAIKGFGIAVILNLLFVDVLFSGRFLVVLFVLYRAATVDLDRSDNEAS